MSRRFFLLHRPFRHEPRHTLAGGAPPGWVHADWLALVAAINVVIISDDEAELFNDILNALAGTDRVQRSSHKALKKLLAAAQARTGSFPAAVVPLYERWLAWLGSPNIYARHYTAIAMIASLRRSVWWSAIGALEFRSLPEELLADIERHGDTLFELDREEEEEEETD